MENATAQKIRDALAKSQSVGIIVAPEPSIDIMAAGLSLYLILKEANKTVSIACPTEPIVDLSSLVGIDKVQPGLGGEAGDLVVSFPYNDGEIDKVSYTIEDGFLNIIVKAGEKGISFDDQDIRYSKGSGPVDLLFVVGTPRLDEIQDVFDTENLRETRIINIDNKQENQGYGDIVIVSPRFSSISELVSDLALGLGMHIDHDIAQNLLSGIINGTKNFQSPTTSPLAFEMASFMLKKGANRVKARSDADYTKPPAQTDTLPNFDRGDQREETRNQQPRQDRNRHGRQPQVQQQPSQSHQSSQTRQPQQAQQQFNQQQRQNRGGQRQPQQNRGQYNEDQQKQKIQTQLRQEDEFVKKAQPEEPQTQTPDDSWLKPKVYKSSSNFEE